MDKIKYLNKKRYIRIATIEDLHDIEKLYDDLNKYLEEEVNYCGWKRGIYPTKETALLGIKNNSLYLLKIDEEIAGAVIIDQNQDKAYSNVDWNTEVDPDKIMVVHTLAINPKYMKCGVGYELMEFVKQYSRDLGKMSVRLDVSIENTPAINLYEKCGYDYIGTVELSFKGLDSVWFRLYELNLAN